MKLRILADDLTGALDSAAAFVGETTVYLDRPGDDDPGVGVVATATRDVPREALPMLLDPARAWLRSADLAFKKVDSLLRGNTYAEVAYTARAGRFSRVVFAPAFPQQGRVTLDGRQWLLPSGRPTSERQPIDDGCIAEAFGVFGLPVVASPTVYADGPVVWLPDVRNAGDLSVIAALSTGTKAQHWLWCGTAGLAYALASVHGFAAGHNEFPLQRLPRAPLLIITASYHPVLREQWAMLKAVQKSAIVVPESQHAALCSALRAMDEGCEVAMFDLSPTRLLIPSEAAALLAGQMDVIVSCGCGVRNVKLVQGTELWANAQGRN